MTLRWEQNPSQSPTVVTASHEEAVQSTTFPLDYSRDIGKKAEMSTNLQKYTLPFS